MKKLSLKSQRQIRWCLKIGIIFGITYLISFGIFRKNHHPSRELLVLNRACLYLHAFFYSISVFSMTPSKKRSFLGWGFGLLHFILFMYISYLWYYEPPTPSMIKDQTWLNHLNNLSTYESILFLMPFFSMTCLSDKVRAKLFKPVE